MRHARNYLLLICLSTIGLISGCSHLGYYAQSIGGQISILSNRQPIDELLQSNDINTALKQKLALVLNMRDFATKKLGLPEDGSYRSYLDIGRPYVVWNIVAAPEFSLQLEEWCFLFAGCIRYRGYFAKEDVIEYAKAYQEKAYDVYLRGVEAYSTLGWFDDPLLNTVLHRDNAHLAGLIFHELAHQVVYVDNDSAFNESFAKTVELEGIRLWMADNGTEDAFNEYSKNASRRNDFIDLVKTTYDNLDQLYALEIPENEKRTKKRSIISEMKDAYHQLKQQWGDYNGYDKWFSTDINNAKIAAITTYADYVPAFTALFQQNNSDFSQFYIAAIALGNLPEKERDIKLENLGLSLNVEK
ncbi:MAG: aminopeptidase [Gammaproteobacteria bacterium]|nr:aminopeptidase [Gammaproteobacteria bacterium]